MISLSQVLMSIMLTAFTAIPPYRWYSPIPFVIVFLTFPLHMGFVDRFMPDHLSAAAALVPGLYIGAMWIAVGLFCWAADRIKPNADSRIGILPGVLGLGVGVVVLACVAATGLLYAALGPYITP